VTPRKRRQYKSGSLYQRSSDGRWFGAYDVGFKRDGSRDRRTVSAKTEVEAKRKLEKALRELNRGTAASSTTTVKAWAERWLEETAKSVTPNAHGTDRAAVGWIVETIGHRRLDRLVPDDVRAVSDAVVAAGKSTSTAARYHGTLRRILTAAQVEGYAVPSNVLLVKGRTPDVSDRAAMSIDEALAALAVASTLPHGSRWLAAFLQGARQGECLGLTWPRISDDALTLDWQLQPLPYRVKRDTSSGFRVPDGYEKRQLEGQLHLVRPKSKAGWRVAPLVPMMADALDRWRLIAPESPHGLVWPALDGSPADENADRDEWWAIQEAAGIGHPDGRWYHVHEIRHAAATMLASLGVDEATRIAIMGHSSIASTRGYEHRDLTLIRSALEKYAGALRQIG
jgi:integrase